MRILVIGGIQFMGRETVGRLVAAGHDVTVVHRRPGHDLGPAVGELVADRNDVAAFPALLREHDFDAVFDFVYDWQRGTTADQVEAAARACGDRVSRYVFISTIAAYGPGTDLREEHPLAPDDHPNPYVRQKASSERALFRLHEQTGFPVTTFRPPFVHGPNQPFYREQFFWDRLHDGRPIILPDGGNAPVQWVYAPDVADACVRVLDRDAAVGQAFNVAHAEITTQRGFIEALARAAGAEPNFVDVPRDAILAAGGEVFGRNLYFGEMLDLPPHTSSIDKARRLLGFEPTPLEASLQAGHAWYRDQPRRPVDYSFEDRLLAQVGHYGGGSGQIAPQGD